MSKNLSELSGRGGIVDNLFDKMGKLAADDGTVKDKDLKNLAKEFLIGESSTYGATTFYDFMKSENKGKKIYVCNGSACLCANTQDKVKNSIGEYFSEAQIGHMTCLGRCHENSAFFYNGKNYSGDALDNLKNIVENKAIQEDNYNVSFNKSILTEKFSNIEKYYSLLEQLLNRDPKAVLDEIILSNLRGRGGAGFPIGIKLSSCRQSVSDTKFIICNADEGDPGAYSDRYLLEKNPHAVLFGMLVAGYLTGAEWGVVYIRAEYPESISIVQNAIDELRANNLLEKNIYGTEFNFDIKIIQAQGAYICGEETALINSIEGQRPEVRTRPPYPTEQGLFNKPTVVNNVETLAALHYVLEHGGAHYKSIGTQRSSGTKLISLDSFFNKPGIVEVEMGTSLKEVIYEYGGGLKTEIKAFHIGGPLGGLVPFEKINELTIDFESFANAGFLLGHASIVSIPATMSMMDYLTHIFDFAAYESCGKCFPCRLGTTRAHELFVKANTEDYKIDRELLNDLLDTLEQGSLCAHGGGIPLPVRNALQYFKEELDAYIE